MILAMLLFLAGTLSAGERAVRGPESLLGDAAIGPIDTGYGSRRFLASNGDEIMLVWTSRGSLYAQRLQRDGTLATPFPTLLLPGTENRPAVELTGAVHAGGLYVLFMNGGGQSRAMRITRDAEVVDVRVLPAKVGEATKAGNEIFLRTATGFLRLREDLSVAGELAAGNGSLVVSPQGLLLLTTENAAFTARYLDGSHSVRIAATSGMVMRSARLVWTGTDFIAAWTACHSWGSCDVSLTRLDAQLQPRMQPVKMERCNGCEVTDLLRLDGERVFLIRNDDRTAGRLLGQAGALDGDSVDLGEDAATMHLGGDMLLSVDTDLNVRLFPAFRTSAPAPVATVQTAVDETVVTVASSAGEAAVVRKRVLGGETRHLVSILDAEGRTLREVAIPAGDDTTLAHDGQHFYALVSNTWESFFVKVESGATPVKLSIRTVPGGLFWLGDRFVVLESGFVDFTGRTAEKTRPLALDRSGALALLDCAIPEIDHRMRPVTVVDTGDTILVLEPRYIFGTVLRFRDGCPAGLPENVPTLAATELRVAWRNGNWAVFSQDTARRRYIAALSDDLTAYLGPWRDAGRIGTWYGSGQTAIAPLGDGWVAAYVTDNRLYTSVLNAAGYAVSSGVDLGSATGRPHLVPLSGDRVLAVHHRQIHEPPYFGARRVVVAPLTLEQAFRRRPSRP